jgi:hypothetical protein
MSPWMMRFSQVIEQEGRRWMGFRRGLASRRRLASPSHRYSSLLFQADEVIQ